MTKMLPDCNEFSLCSNCANDIFLKKHIQDNGIRILCSECGKHSFPAFTIDELAKFISPIMRKYFEPGPDPSASDQDGDELRNSIYEVVGQELDFEDELANAVIHVEKCMSDKGQTCGENTFHYVMKANNFDVLYQEWIRVSEELKHGRRFYSPAAKSLFEWLFDDLDALHVMRGDSPAAYNLPIGTELFRARPAKSDKDIKDFWADPFGKIGPPQKELASSGRMNAKGVPVLYCSRELATCVAEMRPSISSELGVITLQTTAPLRVLDFSRLETARGNTELSYFQPDYGRALQKSYFLRMLHYLISQPITPGHETDYLITQAMAEYLAHVHLQPFDGILFKSSQKQGGMNLVLFSDPSFVVGTDERKFRVEYQTGSVKFHKVTAVTYTHHDMAVIFRNDGGINKQDHDYNNHEK